MTAAFRILVSGRGREPPDDKGEDGDQEKLPLHEDHRSPMDLFRDLGDFSLSPGIFDDAGQKDEGDDQSHDSSGGGEDRVYGHWREGSWRAIGLLKRSRRATPAGRGK